MIRLLKAIFIVFASLNIFSGCAGSSSGGSGGSPAGGSATLVASSSNPASGDGTQSVSSIVYEDSGLSGVKRVKVLAKVNTTNHLVQMYVNEASGAMVSASHSWGTDADASNLCNASCESDTDCGGAVVHSSSSHKITITNAAMTGSYPGNCSSTMSGEIIYPVQ